MKSPKTENLPASQPTSQEPRPTVPIVDSLPQDIIPSDLSLTKTEELFLQQTLMNYPLIDEKFMLHPQIDLIGGTKILIVKFIYR